MTNAAAGPGERIRPFFSSPWAMVIVAMALRLVVMRFVYTSLLDPARDHYAFGYEFGRIARSIATGQGFSSPYPEPTGPTAIVGPVYAYLLAGVFKLFGIYTATSALVILTLNNLFSSLTCLPVFLIARRVFGPAVAAWAGWTWAFFPYSVAGSNVWVWETTLNRIVTDTAPALHAASRTIGELHCLDRLWIVVGPHQPHQCSNSFHIAVFRDVDIGCGTGKTVLIAWAQLVAASLVFLVAVAPWTLRCSRTYGRFVAFRSNFGLEFMVGNSNDTSNPSNWNMLPGENRVELEKLQRIGEPAYMAEKQREAKEVIAHHSLRFAGLTLRRILFTWTDLWNFPPRWSLDASGLPDVLTYSFISLLAFAGIGWAIHNIRYDTIPLLIPLVFFPIVYYLTHQDVRFRHPIDPVVVIFAVYGVISFRRQRAGMSWERHNL